MNEIFVFIYVVFLIGYVVNVPIMALAIVIIVSLENIPLTPEIYSTAIVIMLVAGFINSFLEESRK